MYFIISQLYRRWVVPDALPRTVQRLGLTFHIQSIIPYNLQYESRDFTVKQN